MCLICCEREELGSAKHCSLMHLLLARRPLDCMSDGALDDWSLGDDWKRRSVTVDMFRFLFLRSKGGDVDQRGFNLRIHVLLKHRLMTLGGYFGRYYGWKAMPGSFIIAWLRWQG